jgi:hypothetical protein
VLVDTTFAGIKMIFSRLFRVYLVAVALATLHHYRVTTMATSQSPAFTTSAANRAAFLFKTTTNAGVTDKSGHVLSDIVSAQDQVKLRIQLDITGADPTKATDIYGGRSSIQRSIIKNDKKHAFVYENDNTSNKRRKIPLFLDGLELTLQTPTSPTTSNSAPSPWSALASTMFQMEMTTTSNKIPCEIDRNPSFVSISGTQYVPLVRDSTSWEIMWRDSVQTGNLIFRFQVQEAVSS